MPSKNKATASGRTKGSWVVTTSPDRPIGEVVKEIEKHGFVVDQTLDAIGVITGKLNAEAASAVRKVPGVTDVSPEPSADVGPPGSDRTW